MLIQEFAEDLWKHWRKDTLAWSEFEFDVEVHHSPPEKWQEEERRWLLLDDNRFYYPLFGLGSMNGEVMIVGGRPPTALHTADPESFRRSGPLRKTGGPINRF